MKSIQIAPLRPPVDIYGSTDPDSLHLIVSGYSGTSFTITGITDDILYYTVSVRCVNCDTITKTFSFTVTPTPTVTPTYTPTPTATRPVLITWSPYDYYCLENTSCPNGFTLSPDKTYCLGYSIVNATAPTGASLVVNNRTNAAYSNYGGKLYPTDGYDANGNLKNGYSFAALTNSLWANPSQLTTAGRMNKVGVWAVDNCTNNTFQAIANQYIGFSTQITVPQTQIYYLAIGGDNQVTFKVNGLPVVTQLTGGGADNFKWWHIYPIYLNYGTNFIEVLCQDDGNVSACFGAEIYNNTQAQITNAASESDLNIIFSTKNFFCHNIQAGGANGYSCPSGYALVATGATPTCVQRLENDPSTAKTGYGAYKYRRRLENGVLDGFAEANAQGSGIGPYFPPVVDFQNCSAQTIQPTPSSSPIPSLTPTASVTPTITPSSTTTLHSGCLVYADQAVVSGGVDAALTASKDQMYISITAMQGGYFGQNNIYYAFQIGSTGCRPCIQYNGSMPFTNRLDGTIEIMSVTVTTDGHILFDGYLNPNGSWDGNFQFPLNCVAKPTPGLGVQTAQYTSMVGSSKGYYEYLPAGYSTTNQNYPLMIFIHGLGELGDGSPAQLPKVLVNGPPKLIAAGTWPNAFTVNGHTSSFIVISPQFVWWPGGVDVLTIINYCISKYRVDQNRIYVTGLSMGGGVTWDFASMSSQAANLAAAIVPISGAMDSTQDRAKIIAGAGLAVWGLQNQYDPMVSSQNTIDWFNQINSPDPPLASPEMRMTIFPVSGHDAWTQAYDPNYRENGMNVYEWMLQYGRGPNCIAKGTAITMADGTVKNIEDVRVGDKLMSVTIKGLPWETWEWSTTNLQFTPTITTVQAYSKYMSNGIFTINGTLKSTGEHPHFIKRNDQYLFVVAADVQIGDYLLNEEGVFVAVTDVEVVEGYYETYNLDVDPSNVYFAGGYLTHNKLIQ